MKVYHRTYHAEKIQEDGFRDGEGTYLTRRQHSGVWLADRPLDENEGAEGDVILVLEMPASVLETFEVVEEDKPYLEFFLPAATLNEYPIVEEIQDWSPERDAVRRARSLPERRPGWQIGESFFPSDYVEVDLQALREQADEP